jgi:hypothetical protein
VKSSIVLAISLFCISVIAADKQILPVVSIGRVVVLSNILALAELPLNRDCRLVSSEKYTGKFLSSDEKAAKLKAVSENPAMAATLTYTAPHWSNVGDIIPQPVKATKLVLASNDQATEGFEFSVSCQSFHKRGYIGYTQEAILKLLSDAGVRFIPSDR